MPKAIDFEESNFVFTKPASMTDEECGSLHVHRGEDHQILSCWELTDKEAVKLMGTKKIWLWVWARRHPPVALGVDNPFEQEQKTVLPEQSKEIVEDDCSKLPLEVLRGLIKVIEQERARQAEFGMSPSVEDYFIALDADSKLRQAQEPDSRLPAMECANCHRKVSTESTEYHGACATCGFSVWGPSFLDDETDPPKPLAKKKKVTCSACKHTLEFYVDGIQFPCPCGKGQWIEKGQMVCSGCGCVAPPNEEPQVLCPCGRGEWKEQD